MTHSSSARRSFYEAAHPVKPPPRGGVFLFLRRPGGGRGAAQPSIRALTTMRDRLVGASGVPKSGGAHYATASPAAIRGDALTAPVGQPLRIRCCRLRRAGSLHGRRAIRRAVAPQRVETAGQPPRQRDGRHVRSTPRARPRRAAPRPPDRSSGAAASPPRPGARASAGCPSC